MSLTCANRKIGEKAIVKIKNDLFFNWPYVE